MTRYYALLYLCIYYYNKALLRSTINFVMEEILKCILELNFHYRSLLSIAEL